MRRLRTFRATAGQDQEIPARSTANLAAGPIKIRTATAGAGIGRAHAGTSVNNQCCRVPSSEIDTATGLGCLAT